VIANCATQIYGKASSPPAIERMRGQIAERGGRGDDIAGLKPGEFYVSTEQAPVPVKTTTPWCLSSHPPTPLDPDGVLERARRG
jgi:hypothetical protein